MGFFLFGVAVAMVALGACVATERDDPVPEASGEATTHALASDTTALPAASPSRTVARITRGISSAAAATRAARGTPIPQMPAGTARVSGCGGNPATGDFVESLLTSAGDERGYRLHIPPKYRSNRSTPLVLSFHGYARTAEEQEIYSQLVPIADRETFILVTPEGSGDPQGWDIVGLYAENGIDDVAFVGELLDALEARLCVDPARVYATGLSNGAEMAAQLACTLPQRFAAVAPVAGVVYQGCDGRPVGVISFHGTEDWNVPFEFTPPAMADWAAHNGCATDGGVEVEQVAEHVTRESYGGCGTAPVVLYVVDGGGHTWPGAEDDAGGAGPTTHEINASELIWEFFKAHPRP